MTAVRGASARCVTAIGQFVKAHARLPP